MRTYDPDDEYEVSLVNQALRTLVLYDELWTKNYETFAYRMDTRARIIWWRGAKKQAEAGVPAMRTLLSKVIELRLKG